MSASSLPIIPALSQRRGIPRLVIGFTLLIPALAFLVVFLILPSLLLLSYSVLTQPQSGDIGLPFTLASYERLLFSPAYRRVVILTLRVAFFTSLFTFMLAYPLAMVVAYGRPLFSRVTMILVVAPLVVSVLSEPMAGSSSSAIAGRASSIGFSRRSAQDRLPFACCTRNGPR
jgi:ABC-type spermidine/putrescine transport system permease subunit I